MTNYFYFCPMGPLISRQPTVEEGAKEIVEAALKDDNSLKDYLEKD